MIVDFKEETRALVAELSVLSLQPNCRNEEIYVTRKVLERIYKQGYKDAVANYAVWKDGDQLVGVGQKLLSDVLREVDASEVPIVY